MTSRRQGVRHHLWTRGWRRNRTLAQELPRRNPVRHDRQRCQAQRRPANPAVSRPRNPRQQRTPRPQLQHPQPITATTRMLRPGHATRRLKALLRTRRHPRRHSRTAQMTRSLPARQKTRLVSVNGPQIPPRERRLRRRPLVRSLLWFRTLRHPRLLLTLRVPQRSALRPNR